MPKRERMEAPGEAEGIVVKTKFPVARIKRIVQADEDVGKVAQVTPVVVCTLLSHMSRFLREALAWVHVVLTHFYPAAKALELFMISLTLASAAQARAKSSKRITAQHLRAAVLASEQFDFLSEIVGRIPEAPSASGNGKVEEGKEGKEGKGGKGKRAKEEEEDSEEWDGGGGGAAVKGRKKRAPRRPKSEED